LRLKILDKLRTASLNSEFTGSYKKSVNHTIFHSNGSNAIHALLNKFVDSTI